MKQKFINVDHLWIGKYRFQLRPNTAAKGSQDLRLQQLQRQHSGALAGLYECKSKKKRSLIPTLITLQTETIQYHLSTISSIITKNKTLHLLLLSGQGATK